MTALVDAGIVRAPKTPTQWASTIAASRTAKAQLELLWEQMSVVVVDRELIRAAGSATLNRPTRPSLPTLWTAAAGLHP